MEQGKRQRQVASVIKESINEIFQRLGLTMIGGGMVSISDVKITPDLLEARIYLSFFQVKDDSAALKLIEQKAWEIKKHLSESLKHHLRRIPAIRYYADDTLDRVFHMEELLKKINEESNRNEE